MIHLVVSIKVKEGKLNDFVRLFNETALSEEGEGLRRVLRRRRCRDGHAEPGARREQGRHSGEVGT